MSDRYLHLDAAFLKAELANLIEANPELAEDDGLRADMVEGETNAYRVIERALAERQEAEMLAGGIKEREIELYARRGRFERKSEAMKTLIKSIMRAANLDKLTLTEATLSVLKGRQTVSIVNLDEIPQGYVRIKREADKTAIKAAWDAGSEIPGTALVLGDTGLMIRTK